MKNIFLSGLAAMISLLVIACGSGGGGSGSGSERNTNMGNRAAANSMNTSINSAGNAANMSDNAAAGHEDFMHEAAQGGMAEVEMGKLASQKGQDPDVKKFGQMMVSEHTKVNEELKGIATKKSVPLPTDVGVHKSSIDKLNGLSGADFDRAFVEVMVSDHEKTIALFQKQSESGTDPEVKAFAAKTLPTLKKHLSSIQEIQEKLK